MGEAIWHWIPGIILMGWVIVGSVWLHASLFGREPIAPEPSPELLEAMREVDALLPGTPPIAPPMPAPVWRALEVAAKLECRRANGRPYQIGVRPPPPPPQRPAPTRAPGPGMPVSR